MRVELLSELNNVFRFPVERRARPTLDLLSEIGPDVRQVMIHAETFDLDMPPDDLRDQVGAATAEHIANTVPSTASKREQVVMLNELITPVVAAAINAARDASDAGSDVSDAEEHLAQAKTDGQTWRLDHLQARVDALTLRMAQKMVIAYERAEKAAGVSRAARLAYEGEPWTPFDATADMEALIQMEHRARRWCTRRTKGEMAPTPKLLCGDRLATDGIRASAC